MPYNTEPPVLIAIAFAIEEAERLGSCRAHDRLMQKLAEVVLLAIAAVEPLAAQIEALSAIQAFEASGAPATYISTVTGFLDSLEGIPLSAVEAVDVAEWIDARRDAGQNRSVFTAVKVFLDFLGRNDITSMLGRGTRDEWPEIMLTRPRVAYKHRTRRSSGTDVGIADGGGDGDEVDEDDPQVGSPRGSTVSDNLPASDPQGTAPANVDIAMDGVDDALAAMWDKVA